MNTFDIFVDSAANLPDETVATTGIKVVPFISTVDGKEIICYNNGKTFSETAKEFYESIAAGADVKTSLISEARFVEALTPSLEQGKDVILITITESLSGTFVQARNAGNTLKEKFPDRKIFVIDSANASLGEGLLAIYASRMRDDGKDAETCAKWIEDNKYKLNSHVTINEMKYLKKSGRVSTIIAIAGAILNIKPMLWADPSSPANLAVYAKERGRKKSIDALVKAFTDNVIDPANQTIAIAHCNCADEAEGLAERLRALGAEDILIEFYDLCTGSHVGPGTIALFFMGRDRRGR